MKNEINIKNIKEKIKQYKKKAMPKINIKKRYNLLINGLKNLH